MALPLSLQMLGNSDSWRRVLDALRHDSEKPILIWGPIGCGKKTGVRIILRSLGFDILEMDSVTADDTNMLMNLIHNTRQRIERDVAVFLDGLESFTPDMITRLSKIWDKHAPGPLIMTCYQPKNPLFKNKLTNVNMVRLYKPSYNVCINWFKRTYPLPQVLANKDVCATGDLRRIRVALDWAKANPGNNLDDRIALPFNIFEATRGLVRYENDEDMNSALQRWSFISEARDTALLREHLNPEDIHAAADAFDAFSLIEGMQTSRIEQRCATFTSWVSARTFQTTNRAQDVGALFPPPQHHYIRQETRSPIQGMSLVDSLDVPSSLGGIVFQTQTGHGRQKAILAKRRSRC